MAKTIRIDGRESGTGQDTPLGVCPCPAPLPLRLSGRAVTLSRAVPLSRIACSWKAKRRRQGFSGLTVPAALRSHLAC